MFGFKSSYTVCYPNKPCTFLIMSVSQGMLALPQCFGFKRLRPQSCMFSHLECFCEYENIRDQTEEDNLNPNFERIYFLVQCSPCPCCFNLQEFQHYVEIPIGICRNSYQMAKRNQKSIGFLMQVPTSNRNSCRILLDFFIRTVLIGNFIRNKTGIESEVLWGHMLPSNKNGGAMPPIFTTLFYNDIIFIFLSFLQFLLNCSKNA